MGFSTMTDQTAHPEHHKLNFDFVKLLFQGAFGVGMLAVILVGAAFFLAGADFSQPLQVISVVVGAITGALSAAWLEGPPSRH
jgi:formate/nitrite transporter FocA (FNT family)